MAKANTVSIQTNLNVTPYYEDFDESKNFHRILFRPGLGVQARELTQIQSMLSNQIDRFASHIFKEGSRVTGGELFLDDRIAYVKLRDADSNGTSVNTAALIGSEITGATSGVKARVIDSFDGSEANTPNTKTLYVKFTQSSTNGTQKFFSAGEVVNSNTSLSANVLSTSAQGYALRLTIDEGIIFAKDNFIITPTQSVIIGKYSSNTSARFGYNIVESVVTESTDTTLNDPAQGAYNYNAPGATRLKLNPVLQSKGLNSTSTVDFVEVGRVLSGKLVDDGAKPRYSEIRDYIARRTYDESGNYVVKGMNVRLREHLLTGNNLGVYASAEGGNTSLLSVDVEPGKAYVYGYDIESLVTRHVNLRKGTDYASATDVPIPANYGNYVTVKNLVGDWDVDTHNSVSLRSAFAKAVSNGDFSAASAVGSELGTARVRAIVHSSGTPGDAAAQYKLYLYDINMTANAFAYVRSIYRNNTSTADGKADVVLTSGNAALTETSFNRAIFPMSATNIRRLRDTSGSIDNDWIFFKSFDVTVATDGTFSIATGTATELFPYSAGALNATQKREGFHMVFNSFANTGALTGTVSTTNGSNTITGSGTAFTSDFNVGDRIKVGGHSNTFTISAIGGATSMSTFENAGKATSANVYFKEFPVGHVVDLGGVGMDGSRTATVAAGLQSTSFNIQETLVATANATVICRLTKSNGQEISKVRKATRYVQIQCSNNNANTVGPWNLGIPDVYKINSVRKKASVFTSASQGEAVTSHFTLLTGQNDNIYKHSKLKKKPTSGLSIASGDFLLVSLDYFAHDTSGGIGYFSVDSYPIDDVNGSSNTNAIYTYEIPTYTSPISGVQYNLRDCIDIRPSIALTANDATTVGGATINPPAGNTITTVASGLHFAVPNENFTVDLDYYLRRRDLVTLDKNGNFEVIEGIPSLTPLTPKESDDAIVLARVDVAPYPSLPQNIAKENNRTFYSCYITPIDNARFTMRDIGTIKSRVNTLEYYTSLSLLEQSAKNLLISDTSGNDRFKNGILVDPFTGHNIGDVFDADYSVSIDPDSSELRPRFKLQNIGLEITANSSGVMRKPNDATITLSSGYGTFSNGESITAGGATGTLRWQVDGKLYLENISGTFAVSATATGGSSSANGVISAVSLPAAGDLVTLNYLHDLIEIQPFATTTRNVAPANFNFVGTIILDPAIDNWVDTTRSPDVQTNFDGNQDNWENMSDGWTTIWGAWETVGFERLRQGWAIVETDALQRTGGNARAALVSTGNFDALNNSSTGSLNRQIRRGIRIRTLPNSQENSVGNQVQQNTLLPFMRSNVVQFSAIGLKPNTRVYPFFDGVSVTSYVTPTNSSFANTASEGHKLITDGSGNVYGELRIPNDDNLRFRVGERLFRLTDSSTNSTDLGAVTTSAETVYFSTSAIPSSQDTVVSTRPPQIFTEEVTETRIAPPEGFSLVYIDPLAQTFKIRERTRSNLVTTGVYLTKIDLFFSSKSSTFPVTVEIREVDPSNGYVTKKVLPFGSVTVDASDINTSTDGSKPTPISFPSPVFLREDEYYAIVMRPGGGNGDYRVWCAKLGETDLISGNRVTTQAFETGTLFASSNDKTWTAIQEEDLKFNLYYAKFTNPSSGTLVLKNKDEEYMTVANVSSPYEKTGEAIHGETTLTLNLSPGVNTAVYAAGSNSLANGIVSYVSGSTVRVKDVTLANKYTTGELVTFFHANGLTTGVTANISSQSTPTAKVKFYDPRTSSNNILHLYAANGSFAVNTYIRGQSGGANSRILNLTNHKVDLVHLNSPSLRFTNTSISFTKKLAATTTTRDSTFTNINNLGDTELATQHFVLGHTHEANNISGESSVEIRGALSTNHKRLSPAVDLKRSNIAIIENYINNDSTGETGAGGSALSKYITRKVTLADGQDAEDLKVYLSAYKPSTATIQVYAKLLHGEDSDEFDDRSWLLLTQVTSSSLVSDSEDRENFIEYEYTIPTANLTGTNGEVQYTNSGGITFTGYKYFAIKIVLLSTNTANPPRIRDFRAIALQI